MTRFLRFTPAICLALAIFAAAPGDDPGPPAFGGAAQAAGKAAGPEMPPSLQQRRDAARESRIQRTGTRCRAIARELDALKDRPCAPGDRLDPATDICHSPKNIWMPYSRWDPAAGRCKARDTYGGAMCVATRQQRYEPGRRHAQPLARSLGMYREATARLEGQLADCREATSTLKQRSAAERSRNARQCEQARRLNRADLVGFYCK